MHRLALLALVLFHFISFTVKDSIKASNYSQSKAIKFGIWGFDKVDTKRQHEILCNFTSDGFKFVQTYTAFRLKNMPQLALFLDDLKSCDLEAIIAIQPWSDGFFEDSMVARKLKLLGRFRNRLKIQIADEPRRRGKVDGLKDKCMKLQEYGLESYVQEGVKSGYYPCITNFGVHTHRRSKKANRSLQVAIKSINRINSNNLNTTFVVRNFNPDPSESKKFIDMRYIDLKNEVCSVLLRSNVDNIAFYTYNKRQNGGAGMLQNSQLYNFAVNIARGYAMHGLQFCK